MLKYFDYEEFDSPDAIGSGLPKSDGGQMCDEFLHKIDQAREIAEVPFKITSGFRSKEHNEVVGGKKLSSHLKGCAADILCTNSYNRSQIVLGLVEAGFRRIGIAKTFIHADCDNDKPNAIWLY